MFWLFSMHRNRLSHALRTVVMDVLHFQALSDERSARAHHIDKHLALRRREVGHNLDHLLDLDVENDLLLGALDVWRHDSDALGGEMHLLGGHILMGSDEDT